MRSLAVLTVVLLLPMGICYAGQNANTSIVLHTVEGGFLPCNTAGDPCSPLTLDTEMVIGVPNIVYIYIRNYSNLAYVQTAFNWPITWTRLFGNLCQTSFGGMLPILPGPTTGTLINTFDCVTGGATQVIAVISFIPTEPGCLEQIESAFPHGTHVVSCNDEIDRVLPQARGRICAGSSGSDVCELVIPVEYSTWGKIKHYYQQ